MEMRVERVDDVPLLIKKMETSKLVEHINKEFPSHGNATGIDNGTITLVFLSYILSESDHRLSYVEPWVNERITTLRYSTGNGSLRAKDFTDDKLGQLLDKYGDDERWQQFEHAMNHNLMDIYALGETQEAIRVDAMITQSHRKASGEFQYGYSKQHRADLPQLKTMVATLDPLALPLYSVTVSGNQADDGLYLPVIQQCEQLGLDQQLFVGDSKMSSQAIRSYLQQHGHYYLSPLSKKQCSDATLYQYLDHQPETFTDDRILYKTTTQGERYLEAKAFEVVEIMYAPKGQPSDAPYTWQERRIVVYSSSYGERQRVAFEQQLAKAQEQLHHLVIPTQGRKSLQTVSEVQHAVTSLLNTYQLTPFLQVTIHEEQQLKTIRKYKDRPQRQERSSSFTLDVQIDEMAIQQHLQRLGWRVFASNAPMDRLPTLQAVVSYRQSYRIEHTFDDLLHRLTALMPVFLHKEHRVKALIRLLLLALKCVSVIQYQVRTQLQATQQTLAQLYPGNPKRATQNPTTSMLLRAFKHIHLTCLPIDGTMHIALSPLQQVQIQILHYLGIPPDWYQDLVHFAFSQKDFSEM